MAQNSIWWEQVGKEGFRRDRLDFLHMHAIRMHLEASHHQKDDKPLRYNLAEHFLGQACTITADIDDNGYWNITMQQNDEIIAEFTCLQNEIDVAVVDNFTDIVKEWNPTD